MLVLTGFARLKADSIDRIILHWWGRGSKSNGSDFVKERKKTQICRRKGHVKMEGEIAGEPTKQIPKTANSPQNGTDYLRALRGNQLC